MQMNFLSFAVIAWLLHEQDIIKVIQNGNYLNLIKFEYSAWLHIKKTLDLGLTSSEFFCQ